MATSNTIFRVAELDFDTIKANLRDYLKSQDKFKDYDFEGGGLNILLDILAYNTHYMGYHVNMLANESFLDSAVTRDSIISKAKHLNYTPTSIAAAVANVTITVNPPNGNTLGSIAMPAGTLFQSKAIDNTNYPFVTIDQYTASKNVTSNTFTFTGVELHQGEYLTYQFPVTADAQTGNFIIPSANVDTKTLTVKVQNSSLDTSITAYSLADDYTELTANSTNYFLSAVNDGKYAIYFGDGFLGRKLSNGNIVIVSYVDTSGQIANKVNTFVCLESIGGFSNVITTSVSAATGGADPESLDQIKFRAPIAYTRQNRAVTVNDYISLLSQDYPNIDQIAVWGGQDNDPVVYGKTFVSLKPKDGYVLTDSEKTRITAEILSKRNIITVQTEIVDPNFLYMKVSSKVYYDPTKTTKAGTTIAQLARTAILNFATSELEKFDAYFRFSKLQAAIDDADTAITNNDLAVRLQKRLTPTLGSSKNYQIDFNTELAKNQTLASYPSFQLADAGGTLRTTFIEEVPLSFTGVDSIELASPGSGYDSDTVVTITGDGIGATARAKVVNGKIVSITVTNTGSEYSIAYVTITGSGSGAAASAVLSGDKGTLRTFYYKPNGEKIITNSSIGTIDYSIGRINLYNFKPVTLDSNPYYDIYTLTFTIDSFSQTIAPKRNRIIVIDDADGSALDVVATAI